MMAKSQTFNLDAVADDTMVVWVCNDGDNQSDSDPYLYTDEGYIYAGSGYLGGWGVYGWVYNLALRFTGINVPRGATITEAKISFHTYNNYNGSAVYLDIYGCDEDNSAQMSSGLDFVGRTKTTAKVDWDTTFANSTSYESPDLKTIIQEIIDRSGWSSGNAIQILFTDSNYAYPNTPPSGGEGYCVMDEDDVSNISINIKHTFADSGVRVYNGGVRKVGMYSTSSGRTSALRIYSGSVIRHLALEDPSYNEDVGLRIYKSGTKSLCKAD